ncbi:MAG TPA: acetolactate synthase [Phycisphaerales bacterium]|nr:acetolactate synthase [Phycisphaerales bacterium]
MQFSVFLANRIGQLKELLDLLGEESVEVLGLSVVDSTDWAVIRVVMSDPGKAREVLHRHGTPFTESNVLLTQLDGGNSLSEICGLLLRAEISIHFAYPLTVRSNDRAVMVLHVDDNVLAADVLTRHKIVLLGHEDLSRPA